MSAEAAVIDGAEREGGSSRLYDAIESGVADLDDPDLRERIAGF